MYNVSKRSVRDVNFRGKHVLVRVDFNVPFDTDGNISDDKRIREAIPTIRYLLEQRTAIVLCSHLGRPKGKVVPALSLKPVAEHLQELLPDNKVTFLPDALSTETYNYIREMHEGEIVLLENLRFYPGEEANDPEFAKKLASYATEFVSDAFGAVHRAHASTVGITEFLPSSIGLLVEKEIKMLKDTIDSPQRPFVAVLGGSKVENKIDVIENMLNKCDTILIGGAMAFTFLKAKGISVGKSLVSEDKIDTALNIMNKAKEQGVKMLLPVDIIGAKEFSADAVPTTYEVEDIPDDIIGMDIGHGTQTIYAEIIENAATVLWNGPMGVFEFPLYSYGTKSIALSCANCAGTTIIGGGDSAAAIDKMGIANAVTHVSTGGGAALEMLEGKELPGIKAIMNAEKAE